MFSHARSLYNICAFYICFRRVSLTTVASRSPAVSSLFRTPSSTEKAKHGEWGWYSDYLNDASMRLMSLKSPSLIDSVTTWPLLCLGMHQPPVPLLVPSQKPQHRMFFSISCCSKLLIIICMWDSIPICDQCIFAETVKSNPLMTFAICIISRA